MSFNKILFKKVTAALLCGVLTGLTAVALINGIVRLQVRESIITPEAAAELENVDCIIVPGSLVRPDGSPCDMLADRLRRGVELYKDGAAPKLLMSGDHGRKDYDEVNAMKQYALEQQLPASDIFTDHAGFSTYETIYRAKEIFQAQRVIIVTQQYHLYRALYIARQLGLEAYGVASDYHRYSGQTARDLRELLAVCKDFVYCIFKPEPTYLGEKIDISGDASQSDG